jgi:hypothetical protein
MYLRVMRRMGHYRWFSLFMKHVGSRVDRALIRASGGEAVSRPKRGGTPKVFVFDPWTGGDPAVICRCGSGPARRIANTASLASEANQAWLDEPAGQRQLEEARLIANDEPPPF